MNKYLIASIIWLFLCCSKDKVDKKDQYKPIINKNKVWYVSEFPNPCPGCIWPHKIEFGNDTVINSLKYTKLLNYSGQEESTSTVKPLGFLRETEDHKVYWRINLSNEYEKDILIYDFDANINDTIDNWIVYEIDTVIIQNIKRKRLKLKNCTPHDISWIEGIGDMSYFLSYSSRTYCAYEEGLAISTSGASRYRLNCVLEDGVTIFKDSQSDECWRYKGLLE